MNKQIGLIGCGNLGYPLARHVGQLGFDALHVYDLDERKAAKLKGDIEQTNPALRVMDHLDTDELDVVLLSSAGRRRLPSSPMSATTRSSRAPRLRQSRPAKLRRFHRTRCP